MAVAVKPDRRPHVDPSENVIHLVSSELDLEVGTTTGAIRRVTLKKFPDAGGKSPIRFGMTAPVLVPELEAGTASLKLIQASSDKAEFEGVSTNGNSYHILYTVGSDKPLLYIRLINMISVRDIENERLKLLVSWQKSDNLSNRYNQLEASLLTGDSLKSAHKYQRYIAPIKTERIVPRGTTLLSLTDRYFCISLRPEDEQFAITMLPSEGETIAAEATVALQNTVAAAQPSVALTAYFGPRGHLYLEKYGLEEAFPMGILGNIGLGLLGILSWFAGIAHNHGVAIILLSVLVTCVTAPFTLLSFKSMKKMQELKPQMDKIMAQHKENPQQANREVFGLYKKHRVSPLSGCLPMLLQMPIFLALFQAISHDIELRGKSFLWIADLSLPDRLAKLPISLPLLGDYLNALPVIMAVAMFLQTRLSQQSMPADKTNPAASIMSGPLMSVLFGVMFYQFPSGLVLYWLTNSVMSIVWYRLAR